jgi:hypothetical protein
MSRLLLTYYTPVWAGSPDPASALTEGLPLPKAGDLRSAEGHGQETVPQRGAREDRSLGEAVNRHVELRHAVEKFG